MYDDFGGPGFDWNGNDEHDYFDDYMDMEVTESSSPLLKSSGQKSSKVDDRRVIYDSRKDSDDVAIFKALLVCALCLGGVFLPAFGDAEPLGAAMGMFGAVGLSLAVLKM